MKYIIYLAAVFTIAILAIGIPFQDQIIILVNYYMPLVTVSILLFIIFVFVLFIRLIAWP